MPKKVNTVGKCYAGHTKQCLLCGYEVASSTGIKLHMKAKHSIYHSDEKIGNSCFACGKNFENQGKLMHHLKKEHY